MDTNLVKMRNWHIKDIKQGKLDKPLAEAEDYLKFVAVEDYTMELEEFHRHLTTLVEH